MLKSIEKQTVSREDYVICCVVGLRLEKTPRRLVLRSKMLCTSGSTAHFTQFIVSRVLAMA